MRSFTAIAVAVVSTWSAAAGAQAQFSNSGVPGAQQGDVHAPWSPRYLPLLPNRPVQYGTSTSFSVGNGRTSFYFGTGVRGWGYGWGAPYPYPYWYGDPYYSGPIVLPPLYLPAEELYGPQAARRFMGANGPLVGAPPVIVTNKPVAAANGGPSKPKVRVSNPNMRAQSAKFVAFGDAHFAKQKYNPALERYRLAAQSANDLPETFLRQGFALVAMSRYESAVKAMRRALGLQPDPTKWNLRLDDLYAENRIAKTAHLETLAQAVEENPQSADLLLLLGLQLFFDGQADRAISVFRRCDQLGGNEDRVITGFLRGASKDAAGAGKEI